MKNHGGGRVWRAKGLKHRRLAVGWSVLAHNLAWISRKVRKERLEAQAKAACAFGVPRALQNRTCKQSERNASGSQDLTLFSRNPALFIDLESGRNRIKATASIHTLNLEGH